MGGGRGGLFSPKETTAVWKCPAGCVGSVDGGQVRAQLADFRERTLDVKNCGRVAPQMWLTLDSPDSIQVGALSCLWVR